MSPSLPDPVTGNCNCGAIGISIPRASFPAFSGLCHCNDCKVSSGSCFSVNLPTATDAITLTGTPKTYGKKAESGNTAQRHFCGDCGSPIMTIADENPGLAFVKGALFVASGIEMSKPGLDIFWKRAEKWEKPVEGALVKQGFE